MLFHSKHLKIGSYGILAILIITVATLIRIVLIAFGWPHSNADESTMGIMAMHILLKGEHPIFYYGQNYMGTLEAYLGSFFFSLFGASVFALRLGPILFYALFLANMYLLTTLLYSKKLALITLIILSLGSCIMLDTELVALGGYPELLFFGSLSMLLVAWLSISHDQYIPPRTKWLRLFTYAGWGIVCGLGFWSDFLMLSFILLSGLFLVIFCLKELLKGAVLFLILGLLLGSTPLIIYNLNAPSNLNTLIVLKDLHNNGNLQLANMHYHGIIPFGPQLRGTFLTTLPAAIGGQPFCFDAYTQFRLSGYLGHESSTCSILHGNLSQAIIALVWSLGFTILWSISTYSTIKNIWDLCRRNQGNPWAISKKQALIRNSAGLMLLCSAALILYLYISSPISAAFPPDSRYLIGLLISTPALIWPLWELSSGHSLSSKSTSAENTGTHGEKFSLLAFNFSTLKTILGRCLLALLVILLLVGTINAFLEIPTVQAYNQQQDALINKLSQLKISHFYTEYWTCDSTAFLAKEQIICTSIDDALHPRYNRYLPYVIIVKSDPNAAYVFPVGASQLVPIARKIAHSPKQFIHLVYDGYVIYKPL